MDKQQFLIGILIVVIITALILSYLQRQPKYGEIIIGEKKIRVEIADTLAKRKKGLSGRENLKENTGMLFVFLRPGKYGIWMKDMKFPIDTLWIQGDKIIKIASNMTPDDQKTVYYPEEEVDYVLELNAGFVEENNLNLGDEVLVRTKLGT